MIFSDITTLNDIINSQRSKYYEQQLSQSRLSTNNSNGTGTTVTVVDDEKRFSTGLDTSNGKTIFRDMKDLTVDRWYNSSPPMTGTAIYTYEFEDYPDDSPNEANKGFSSTPDRSSIKMDKAVDSNKEANKVELFPTKNKESTADLFRPIPVEKVRSMDQSDETGMVSLLTARLNSVSSKNGNETGDGVSLTVYVPMPRDPLAVNVIVPRKSVVSDIIKIVLKEHEKRALKPRLDYSNPKKYELRMHEGDGEPDMDFAPFELTQDVKAIYQTSQSNEYCLCECDDDNTSDDSDYMAMKGRRNSTNSRAPPPLYRDDSTASEDILKNDDISSPKLNENSILLKIAQHAVGVNINEKTTLRDVLPLIATRHKLRLYVDEFVFLMTTDEQKRLNLMSPVADMDVPIKTIGATEFELQKKVYADAARITRSRTNAWSSNMSNPLSQEKFIYNDATAVAYQEWMVVKKNKFGRRQDRYIGIDGSKVYNSKRGQYSSTGAGGVYRAQRDISQIRKVEYVRDDPEKKTLRITWAENREEVDIEYTCETERHCNEIYSKLKYLMKRNAALP